MPRRTEEGGSGGGAQWTPQQASDADNLSEQARLRLPDEGQQHRPMAPLARAFDDRRVVRQLGDIHRIRRASLRMGAPHVRCGSIAPAISQCSLRSAAPHLYAVFLGHLLNLVIS